MAKNKLTVQQKRFVEAMAHPGTKSQHEAAIAAGCPPKNARITASRWLTKANILNAIAERRRKVVVRAGVTPEEVIGFAAFQMRSSIEDVLDESGSFDLAKARATGAIDIVKKIKQETTTIKRRDGAIQTTAKVEIEVLPSSDGRRALAEYMGVKK